MMAFFRNSFLHGYLLMFPNLLEMLSSFFGDFMRDCDTLVLFIAAYNVSPGF